MKKVIARHSFGNAETTSPRSGGLGGLFWGLLLLTSCTSDTDQLPAGKYPLELTAANISVAQSRSTTADDNVWTEGDEVGVSVNGSTATYKYKVADVNTGKLTSDAPYYWQNYDNITVTAWYPYNNGTEPGSSWTVEQDQSSDEKYQASDLLKTEATTISFNGNEQLTFTHQGAKVVVTLTAGTEMTADEIAKATIYVYDGTQFIQSHAGSAIIVPTTIAAYTPFIKATIDGIDYQYVLPSAATFAASHVYNYEIEVSKSGMKLGGCTIGGWTDKDAIKGDAVYGSAITLNVATAGTLTETMVKDVVEDGNGYVTITGNINQSDLTNILAYGSSYVSLDLSGVSVEGTVDIGESFKNNSKLISIALPSNTTSIPDEAFICCTSLQSIEIPDGITSIGEGAFNTCKSLQSVEIPDGVTSIEAWTFYGCSSLTSVTIPSGVTKIGTYAFAFMPLTSVTIPSKVTSIGSSAFYECRSLKEVTVNPTSPCTIEDMIFGYYGNMAQTLYADGFTIYVPSTSVSTYKAASGWSDYADFITAIPTE